MSVPIRPIGIFYEHPTWFKPLFAELEKRRIPFVRINAAQHQFNPQERDSPFSLVVNRISPSAHTRGNAQGIFYANSYLTHLERLGISVINGTHALGVEISKSRQLSLLAELGLSFPKSRIVNHVDQITAAARALRFPILIKANIGGSGAGIRKFNTPKDLQKAISLQQINLGIDSTALIQEYLPPKGGHIVRVETLNGKYLYAIKIYPTSGNFNLCPSDISIVNTAEDYRVNLTSVSGKVIKVEKYTPPDHIIRDVERIAKNARLDVGGIEYLINESNDQAYYYDINALSNFVVDARQIIGFDPYVNFVDYIESRLFPIYEIEKVLPI